jgi:hypothetical protein
VGAERLLPVSEAFPERNLVLSQACDQRATLGFFFLLLFTVAIYARPEDIFPSLGQLHLTLAFGLCASLAYLGALLSAKAPLVWTRELRIVLLLTGWYVAGVPFAFWRSGSFQTLTQVWSKTLLGFFLLSQTLTTVGRVRKVLWAMILSELIVTGVSIALSGNAALRVGDRVAGISQGLLGWNYFGIAVAHTIPYLGILYLSRRSLLRTALLIATVAVMMWMLVLTASRGGSLSVLFSIILTWWFVLRGSARGRIAGLVVVLLLLVSIVRAPDIFFIRLQTIWNGSEATSNETVASAEESTEGRKFLLDRAIMYTLRCPIFGVGMGDFPVINGTELDRADAWYSTHNTFTQMSSEAGIPALVFFLLLLATVVSHMKRVSEDFANDPANNELRLLARATLVSVVSLAFGGFFLNMAYDGYFYYPVGIAAGLWAMSRQSAKALLRRAESSEPLPAIPSTKWSSKWL